MCISWTALPTEEASVIFSFKTDTCPYLPSWTKPVMNSHSYHLSEISKLSPLVAENTKPSNRKAGRVNSLAEFLIVCSGSSQWSSWLSLESYACCFGFAHHVSLIFSTSHRISITNICLKAFCPWEPNIYLAASLTVGLRGESKLTHYLISPQGEERIKRAIAASFSCLKQVFPVL